MLLVLGAIVLVVWLVRESSPTTGLSAGPEGSEELLPGPLSAPTPHPGTEPAGSPAAGTKEPREAVAEQREAERGRATETYSIAGRVLDWEEKPVRHFQIFAFCPTERRGTLSKWFTSDTGEFELDGFTEGSWMVSAKVNERRRSARASIQIPYDEELVLHCSTGAMISGVVLHPGGTGLAGAEVSWGGGSTISEEGGLFRLVDVIGAGAMLTARFEDLITAEPVIVANSVVGHHSENVVLQLVLGGQLTGVVVDAQEEGEPGVEIEIVNTLFRSPRTLCSEEDGTFDFGMLRPGRYVVRAKGSSDGERERLATAEVLSGETTHVVLRDDIELPVTIHGLVTRSGEPVGGGVVAYPDGHPTLRGGDQAAVGTDGRFKLLLRTAGPHVFVVRTNERCTSTFPVEVPPEPTHDVHLELSDGGISGTMLFSDGEPASGHRVMLELLGTHNHLESKLLPFDRTDEKGQWSFDGLAGGSYAVYGGTHAAGVTPIHCATLGGIELGEGEQVTNLVLTLQPAGIAWCRVLDSSGQPVNGAAIFVRDARGEWVNPVSRATTFDRGTCATWDLQPGTYTFLARTRDCISAESRPIEVPSLGTGATAIEEAPWVELRLAEGAGLRASLVDGDGQAVRARFRVRDDQGREHSGTSCFHDQARILEHGHRSDELWLTPLLPGKYQVVATGPDGLQATGEVVLRAGAAEVLVLKR